MSIQVVREPEGEPAVEHCCFCEKRTAYWTDIKSRKPGAQVACCEECAAVHKVSEVPTKAKWCAKMETKRRLAAAGITNAKGPAKIKVFTAPLRTEMVAEGASFKLVGPEGTVIHLSWDEHIGGFRLLVERSASGALASHCSVWPSAANVVIVKAEMDR
jgi:hypothetical protein